MTNDRSYLHRLHYQITPEDYSALRVCLSTRGEAMYARSVHTMFFYSYRDRIPASNTVGGIMTAEQGGPQFSLRYYDGDPTYVILERRQGELRTSTMVAEAECRALLQGETDWLMYRHDPLLQEFHEGLTEKMLLPQMMLTYQQEVYSAADLNLWVTLDTDIRASLQHMDFLDPQQLERDTEKQTGKILMEVNYSDQIPDSVLCLLEETAPRRRLLRRNISSAQQKA